MGEEKHRNNSKIVCHVMNSIMPSGAETMLQNSADLWEGYEKYMIATAKDIGPYAQQCADAGYHILHVSENNFIQHHKKIRRIFRKLSPDVVHIHRESQECYYALDAKVTGVHTIVRTVHSIFNFHGILRIRRVITRGLGRLIGEKYVAIGKSVYDNEIKTFFNRPVRLIDNWCDEEKFQFVPTDEQMEARENIGISKDTFVILSVGNCNAIKNHILLIESIHRLKNTYRDAKILYLHVGHGDEEENEKKYVSEHGLDSIIRFVGYADPVPYYKIADLNVMTSLYEGVGVSAIEAMLTGIPCLLTEVNGLKDFKVLQSDDIYYSSLDVNELTKQIETIYEKFEAGKLHHSKELSNAVKKKYSRSNSVRQYLEIYEKNNCKCKGARCVQ